LLVSMSGTGESAPDAYPPGYRALGAVPGFFRLLGSAVLARTAARTYAILLVLFALAKYHSASLSGLVVLASQLPGLLASPLAGALLDRRGRITLIRLDFYIASFGTALITVLDLAHLLPVWSLFVIVVLSSLTQPLSATGTRSLFPVILPRLLWDRANGLDGSSFVIATIGGPVIAGGAVALVGTRYGLLVPVALYLVAGTLLLGVHVPDPARPQEHLVRSAVNALRYVFTHKTLRQLAVVSTFYNGCVGTLGVAIPVLVLDRLHGGSTTVGLMLAVIGLGGTVSSILTGVVGTWGREHVLTTGSCVVGGLAFGLVALVSRNEALCFIAFFVIGLTNGPVNITLFGVRQRVTHPEWFGRAFAISMSLNGVGTPVGSAIVGVILTHSIPLGFLLGMIVSLGIAAWTAAFPYAITDVESSAAPLRSCSKSPDDEPRAPPNR
jgi:MFS family permease